ncbi:MAG: GWxTD domain-containing protein [bacterium]|nr:GWxTD domain-containing protein [bacterium]
MTELQAVGWSILHSLWQGALIALLVAASQLTMSSARLRYGLACAGLALLLLAPVATFSYLNGGPAQEFVGSTVAGSAMRPGAEPVGPAAAASWRSVVEPTLPWLVGLWACGVVVLSARSLGAWWLLRGQVRGASEVVPEEWREALERMRSRVGVSRPVRLLRSAAQSTPMVIGWLRPVILIPPAAVAGLSPHQLEAILAHELAHIRRHDYFINLLQTAAETLLFYHPAVWWLSSRIRQEREHCADEVAAEICGNPADYARALLTLEETRPAIAMSATGASLKTRIERLLYPDRLAASPPTATFLAALTLVLAAAVPALLAQQMPSRYANWLAEDVAYIITDVQKETFERLTSNEARDDFIQEFWKELDPDPATPENEFKVEHYRRIAYANERYQEDKTAGWKTERGQIYILHGPPDEIESHPSDYYELWFYRGYVKGLGTEVIFEFDLTGNTPVKVSN